MILSPIVTTELDDSQELADDLSLNYGYDVNDNERVMQVVHHDIIEAIHKEILQKTKNFDNGYPNDALTFEGIVHIDCRESHYRVQTESLKNVGFIYSVKICTITHPSSNGVDTKNQENHVDSKPFMRNNNNPESCSTFMKQLANLNSEVLSLTSKNGEPLNSDSLKSPKTNALLNKMEEVFRGPTSYHSSGASGFGFAVHKKNGSEVLDLFLCPLCVYCCVKKGELRKHHTAVHLDGKPYGCTFCPYRSTHKSTLRSHVMSRHTGERPFKCPECDYHASQKGLVDKHIMTKHTGEKPYKCPFCEFSSSHSSTVKTHVMFKHTGEKPFECPQCNYRAVQRGHVLRHMKSVHSGEKPFKCPHCEYRACRNNNIKKHVTAVHNKEKPFKCPKCDFKSSHKGNLTSHVISKHTQMKPFACELCDYKSSCRTGLNRHLLKHKPVEKIELICNYCTYSSPRKDHLRTHIIYVHFRGDKSLLSCPVKLVAHSDPNVGRVKQMNRKPGLPFFNHNKSLLKYPEQFMACNIGEPVINSIVDLCKIEYLDPTYNKVDSSVSPYVKNTLNCTEKYLASDLAVPILNNDVSFSNEQK